jgi:hypothetical protein
MSKKILIPILIVVVLAIGLWIHIYFGTSCYDGQGSTIYIPKNQLLENIASTNATEAEKYFVPPAVSSNYVAKTRTNPCGRVTNRTVMENGVEKSVSQSNFDKFISDYNAGCSNCLMRLSQSGNSPLFVREYPSGQSYVLKNNNGILLLESTEKTTPTQPSKSDWIITTNQQLGISFEHPADASVSSVSQKQTSDGAIINELTVAPKGMDPTVVHFFTTSASLDKAKNIQIYGFTQVKNSEFTNATIDGRAGIRRIDHYLNNDCTNELIVAEKNGVVYGFHIVQCPTHPQGYDQLRKDIANSIKFL